MPRPTIFVRLECNYCKKYFNRIKWAFTQDERHGIKKYYCNSRCKNKFQSENCGENSPNWKGGRQKHKGYIKIWVSKNKRVLEHRAIMEKKLGRKLKKGEVVHHINGKKNDNRIENLIVCKTHGEHTVKYHPEIYENQRKRKKK